MTPELDATTLGRLEAALALDVSPTERELTDLRALVAGSPGSVYVLPRLTSSQPPRRTSVRAVAAAIVVAAAVTLAVVTTQNGAGHPESAPNVAVPSELPVDPASGMVAREMSAVRDALARRDPLEVVSTRDGLLRALAALPPSARAQVQSEAESLLAEVEVFLADATRPGVAVPPTTGPVAPEGLDDPIDGVSPADDVAPAPSTPPAEHEPEHEDD